MIQFCIKKESCLAGFSACGGVASATTYNTRKQGMYPAWIRPLFLSLDWEHSVRTSPVLMIVLLCSYLYCRNFFCSYSSGVFDLKHISFAVFGKINIFGYEGKEVTVGRLENNIGSVF